MKNVSKLIKGHAEEIIAQNSFVNFRPICARIIFMEFVHLSTLQIMEFARLILKIALILKTAFA
jgi:hypothetical protein